MDIKLNIVVPNKVNPEQQDLKVNLSIDHKNSFSPKEIAKQVPQIRALLMAKQLLLELQSTIANKKELGALLNKLYADKETYNKVKQQELKEFSAFQIPIAEKKQDKTSGDKE